MTDIQENSRDVAIKCVWFLPYIEMGKWHKEKPEYVYPPPATQDGLETDGHLVIHSNPLHWIIEYTTVYLKLNAHVIYILYMYLKIGIYFTCL